MRCAQQSQSGAAERLRPSSAWGAMRARCAFAFTLAVAAGSSIGLAAGPMTIHPSGPAGAPLAPWAAVDDGVMGGVSSSRATIAADGNLVFAGFVSLENNGGFASTRRPIERGSLAGARGFIVTASGDGKRYRLVAQTASQRASGGGLYQASFVAAPERSSHLLLLADFKPSFRGRALRDAPALDPSEIVSIGLLIADAQAGAFALTVTSIEATPADQPK